MAGGQPQAQPSSSHSPERDPPEVPPPCPPPALPQPPGQEPASARSSPRGGEARWLMCNPAAALPCAARPPGWPRVSGTAGRRGGRGLAGGGRPPSPLHLASPARSAPPPALKLVFLPGSFLEPNGSCRPAPCLRPALRLGGRGGGTPLQPPQPGRGWGPGGGLGVALSLLVAGACRGWRGLARAAVLLAPGIAQLQHSSCPRAAAGRDT